jgi:amidohydrolase
LKADKNYIIEMRRQLHQIPEIGFELPKTLSFVRQQLETIGLPYTESYGKSCIVATLNEGVGNKTIAIRADMDALPVQEETGLAFASAHPGQMHACGHDCHTAMLLGTAKKLKEMENDIHCCVKFVFQSAEEGPGGAKTLCDDGLMDQVDLMIGCHIYPEKPTGTISLNNTCQNAGSHGFKIYLQGKSCHVAKPDQGVDAIAMAMRVYSDIQIMRARELNPFDPVVIGIGEIHGGKTNNVICDNVMMHGTIRTHRNDLDAHIYKRIEEIAHSVANDMGGIARVETTKHYPVLLNDKDIAQAIINSAQKVVGKDMIRQSPLTMGAEDFAYYTLYKPSALFCLGAMPEDGNFAPLHNGKMTINEDVLDIAPNVFIQFVLDNM